MLRNSRIREQVLRDAAKLCQLAEELRDEVAEGSKHAPRSLDAVKAPQIEKPA